MCNGGAFFWVASHDINGSWSDSVVGEVRLTAGCSVVGTPSPTYNPTSSRAPNGIYSPTISPTPSPSKLPYKSMVSRTGGVRNGLVISLLASCDRLCFVDFQSIMQLISLTCLSSHPWGFSPEPYWMVAWHIWTNCKPFLHDTVSFLIAGWWLCDFLWCVLTVCHVGWVAKLLIIDHLGLRGIFLLFVCLHG